MHSFSFGEIALIFGIVVILFGGSRLASIGKSLGEGIANFKKGLNQANDDLKQKEQMQVKQTHVEPTQPQQNVQNANQQTMKAPVIDAPAQVTSSHVYSQNNNSNVHTSVDSSSHSV